MRGPICYDFIILFEEFIGFSQICKFITVGVNVFIKAITIFFMDKVGGET